MQATITKKTRKNRTNKRSQSRRFAVAPTFDKAHSTWEFLEAREMMSVAPVVATVVTPAHSMPTVQVPLIQSQTMAPNAPAISVGNTWQNNALGKQTTAFQVAFDATPSQANANAVIGLSNGPASAYTELAAIVRFNSTGQIDVRNAGVYKADTTVNYTAGTSYHFIMEIDPTTQTYSVYVTPQGETQTLVAANYSFRTEQANTTALSNLSGISTAGTAQVANVIVTGPSAVISSSWTNASIGTQTNNFEFDFAATPGQQNVDSVVGLSSGNAGKYSDLAAIVRFDSSNQIDARNGGVYQADTTLNYVAGTTYAIRMVVNVTNDTYSVYVTPQGGSEVLLASNYQFRTEQASDTSLDTVAAYNAVGTTTLSNLTVTLGSTAQVAPVVQVAPSTPFIAYSRTSSTEIDLGWVAISGATGYTIQRSTDGVNFTTVDSVTSAGFKDTGLNASTTYSYQICAVNAAGQSGWSNISTQTTAAPVAPVAPVTPVNPVNPGISDQTGAEPGPTNTGPTNTAVLVPTGSMTITTPNTHLSNLAITGTLYIDAPGCTIDNFTINANGGTYGIQVAESGASLVATNGTITNSVGGAVFGQNYTMQYVQVHNVGSDAFDGGWNTSILDCYVYSIGASKGAHADGFQAVNGQNIVIEGNFFDIPQNTVVGGVTYKSNSCVFLEPPKGNAISNVTISNNWLVGGNFAIYAADDSNVSVTDNTFGNIDISTGEQYGYMYQGYGSVSTFSGNVGLAGNSL